MKCEKKPDDRLSSLCHLAYHHPLPDLPTEGCVVLGEDPGPLDGRTNEPTDYPGVNALQN